MKLPERYRSRPKVAKKNPDWVDELLIKHWDAAVELVGPEMMPLDNSAPMVEYGCGFWGCVLPVLEQEVVLKVTTDMREAVLASAAIEMGHWPDGIAPYAEVVALSDRYFGAPVFLLWRQEAYHVGALELERLPGKHRYDPELSTAAFLRAEGEQGQEKDLRLRYAQYVDQFGAQAVSDFQDLLRLFLEKATPLGDAIAEHADDLQSVLYEPFVTEQSELLASIAHDIEAGEFGHCIGEALNFYLAKGLLLGDVHLGNIGEILDPLNDLGWEFAITDGSAYPLHPKWGKVKIPVLEQHKRARR